VLEIRKRKQQKCNEEGIEPVTGGSITTVPVRNIYADAAKRFQIPERKNATARGMRDFLENHGTLLFLKDVLLAAPPVKIIPAVPGTGNTEEPPKKCCMKGEGGSHLGIY
jgi:hypothetical protein